PAGGHDRTAVTLWPPGAVFVVVGDARIAAYRKTLPIARGQEAVLIAYEMNGEPLPGEHGFPARLIVPGFYGTNSVKWLTRMTLSDRRAPGPFTSRWYNDPVRDGVGRETGQAVPVWSIGPDSLIVSPAPHETIELSSAEREIWGWAWADGGVRNVYIRTEDAATWRRGRVGAATWAGVAALFDAVDAETERWCSAGFTGRVNEWVAAADIGMAQRDLRRASVCQR